MKMSWLFTLLIVLGLAELVKANLATEAFITVCKYFEQKCRETRSEGDCGNCMRVCRVVNYNTYAGTCSSLYPRDYSNFCALGASLGAFPFTRTLVSSQETSLGALHNGGSQKQTKEIGESLGTVKDIGGSQKQSKEIGKSVGTVARWRPMQCNRRGVSCPRCCEHEYYWCHNGTTQWDTCLHCMGAMAVCAALSDPVTGSGFSAPGSTLARRAFYEIDQKEACKFVVADIRSRK